MFFFCFFFEECRTDFLCEFVHSCGMALPHITNVSDFAIRKVSFNPNKGRLSVIYLRSPGPIAEQPISVSVNCRFPFQSLFNSSSDSDVP